MYEYLYLFVRLLIFQVSKIIPVHFGTYFRNMSRFKGGLVGFIDTKSTSFDALH